MWLHWLLLCSSAVTLLAARVHVRRHHPARIMGGHNDTIRNAPWQVSIQCNGKQCCGGSILSETIVVTAAHCISEDFQVRAGATNNNEGGQLVNVIGRIVHENYKEKKHAYDVAVLLLSEPLKLNDDVQIIQLATNPPPIGAVATVSGWGMTESGYSIVLKSVDVEIWNHTVCEQSYQHNNRITEEMLCAALPGKDSCQNDSGGPLVYKRQLVGIVSWGIGCAVERYPGIYANVAFLRQWILQAAAEFATNKY